MLPLPNYALTKYLIKHLYKVEKYSKHNLMSSTNLAIVFGPTLLRPKEEALEHTLMLPRVYLAVQRMIEQYNLVFRVCSLTLKRI